MFQMAEMILQSQGEITYIGNNKIPILNENKDNVKTERMCADGHLSNLSRK